MGEVGASQSHVEAMEHLEMDIPGAPDSSRVATLDPVMEETEASELSVEPTAEHGTQADSSPKDSVEVTDTADAEETAEILAEIPAETADNAQADAEDCPLPSEGMEVPVENLEARPTETVNEGEEPRCHDHHGMVTADGNGGNGPGDSLDLSGATLLCEDLAKDVACVQESDAVQAVEPTAKDDDVAEVPLPSETVLVPGSPTGQKSNIPDAVFHEVPLMPPENFFDPSALEKLKEEAMAEYSELLSWLLSPLECEDPEKALRQHQEEEENEAECRTLVLHVARRQMWRERIKTCSQQKVQDVVVDELLINELKEKLSDMKEEASALVETIDERQVELSGILKQQQDLRGEIATWSNRVTEMEARAVDQRMGKVVAQGAPGIFRAESLPALWKTPSPAAYPPSTPIPAWAQRAWVPVPSMPSTPSPVPVISPLSPPVISSPGRVAGVSSGGLGSPPCRVIAWSPRSPWSPASALLPPRVQSPRPGSLVVPAGSLQLPPGQAKAQMMVPNMAARMVTSFSTGQLPKMVSPVAQAPQSPVRPVGAPASPCQSFRQISPVRVPV